jgi:hypothetical protein
MLAFKWRQFAGEVILWSVRWYCRYGISYRELEVDFPPESGGVGSERHAAAGILMSSMSALASTGVR